MQPVGASPGGCIPGWVLLQSGYLGAAWAGKGDRTQMSCHRLVSEGADRTLPSNQAQKLLSA